MRASSVVDAVKLSIGLLVESKYDELEAVTNRERLSSEQIESAIVEYGRQLIPPPIGAYSEHIDSVQVVGALVPTWSIRMPLWTKEEGRSDLTVELTIAQEADAYRIELDGIHVL
jgi:hypothetical protein